MPIRMLEILSHYLVPALSKRVVVYSFFPDNPNMFTRIQASSFRCLKSVDQSLGPFRALVGPNASGKTTFLDVIGFLGDLVKNRGDVLRSIQERSGDFEKLLWMGLGHSFQLAVEAEIPAAVKKEMDPEKSRFNRVRYEVEIGLDSKNNEIGLDHEILWLQADKSEPQIEIRDHFPAFQADIRSIFCRSSRSVSVEQKAWRQ